MNNAQPMFDSATNYWIEMTGRVDVEWLQNLDSSAEITVQETKQMENTIVINVQPIKQGSSGWCAGCTD